MSKLMMIVVGGPNGAGKTTLSKKLTERFDPSIEKMNADERTLELKKAYPDSPLPEINLLAAQQIDAEIEQNIRDGKSFYVETVLSSAKYRDDVLEAKKRGYKIALLYVSLYPPELSAKRVKQRAQRGGHDVVWDKVVERYHRSHKQLEWFAAQADVFFIYDNSQSDQPPILLAAKMAGQEITHRVKGVNPEVDRVVSLLRAGGQPFPTP